MLKMALFVHVIVMPTLMGILVVSVLVTDRSAGMGMLLGAAAAGFVLSVPVSFWIAQRILRLTGGPSRP